MSLFASYESVQPINKKTYFPKINNDSLLDILNDYSDDVYYYSQPKVENNEQPNLPKQDWFTVKSLSKEQTDPTDYTSMDLQTILNQSGLNSKIRITSGYREKNINPNSNHGKKNEYGHSMAYDIVPIGISFDEMYKLLKGNDLVNKWLFANGFNINDETSAETLKKTHGTGAHYHIGPDKFNIKTAKNGLKFEYYESVGPIKKQETNETDNNEQETFFDKFIRFFNKRDEIQPLIVSYPNTPQPDEIIQHPESEQPIQNISEQNWFKMPEFNNDIIEEKANNRNNNNTSKDKNHFTNWLKSWEGGYTQGDGGTNMGVTFDTWKRHNLSKDINKDGIIDKQDLQKMPESDFHRIVDIYKNAVRFDDINDKDIAQLMFQFAWGSGPENGIRTARKILGLKNSSVIDDDMIAYLNHNPKEKFETLKDGRRKFLNSLNKSENIKKGWMRRLDSMRYGEPWKLNN